MPTVTDTFKELIANDRQFIENLFVIENKQRQLVPFKYNDIQADADASETGMDIWVKPAQVGFSSERIAKRLKGTLTNPGTNTVLVAYEDFITERLLSKVTFHYSHLRSLGIPNFPEIHHDCLPYHTKIQLEDGSFRQIGQIVNKREKVKVLTCNLETGDVEPKPIVRWFKYPSRHTWIVLGSGHKFSHMMTPNHHIYTQDGWKMAGDVELGDNTWHNGFIPNDDQRQLIIGSLLGDASFQGIHGIAFAQADYKYARFKYLVLADEASELRARTNHGYSDNPIYSFGLHSCPEFESYSVDGIDARGLAIWYCDNGNRSDSNGSVNFLTECFTEEQHGRFINVLWDRFGIKAKIVPHGSHIMLNIPNLPGSDNHKKFFTLISRYVPRCMEYKLPPEFRGLSKHVWNSRFSYGLIPYNISIKDVALTNNRIYNYEYSLEVADNHNFFTSVGLVKNSTYEKTFRFYLNGRLVSTSSIYIASARSYVAGRAEVIHHLLFDEFAFYPGKAMDDIISPALDRVPPEGTVDIYSTPNGQENDFYGMYQMAKEGKSVFTPHCYTWFQHKEYAIPLGDPRLTYIPETNKPEFRLSLDEEKLVRNHNLTFDQIRWRRWKIKQKESLRRSGEMVLKFQQEFPEDDVSCFLAVGNTYYEDTYIERLAKGCYPAPTITPDGLHIWYPPERGRTYIVAIDPGQERITLSAIGVLTFDVDSEGNYKPRWCARDAGLYSPEVTYNKAIGASNYYNRAMITWEDNAHGLALTVLLKNRRPIYFRKDLVQNVPTTTPGWRTTPSNKPFMLQKVSGSLADLTCHDIELVGQFKNVRRLKDGVEIVGADDIHDSYAIGLMCLDPRPQKYGYMGRSGWRNW
jgi:hypothetical protein